MDKKISRPEELTGEYLSALDTHLSDLVEGRVTEMMEINEIADQLHVHPTHLSNAVKKETGESACSFYQEKILYISKSLLEKNEMTITDIAHLLTYDPSNFTKFFKSYTNKTPKQYRDGFLKRESAL